MLFWGSKKKAVGGLKGGWAREEQLPVARVLALLCEYLGAELGTLHSSALSDPEQFTY